MEYGPSGGRLTAAATVDVPFEFEYTPNARAATATLEASRARTVHLRGTCRIADELARVEHRLATAREAVALRNSKDARRSRQL